MFRPDPRARAPPPFGRPPLPALPFRPAGPGAPFTENPFCPSRPPGAHFISPHCSNFSIDCSTVIALSGSQQIAPPAETAPHPVPLWKPSPVKKNCPDSSDRAGEEFLRCIATNKPLPDYLKGNMAYNLAEAFKSADVLKEALRSDPKFQKHVPRSKSRSRSNTRSGAKTRGRSRSRSRGRSRSRSRGRSQSRGRSRGRNRSRGHSRGRSRSRKRSRSRGRSKSRVRSKNCGESKNRGRSWSRTRSRSGSRSRKKRLRSKSQVGKPSSGSSEVTCGKDEKKKKSSPSSTAVDLTRNSLLEELKLAMSNSELEDCLPSLKAAILTIQNPPEDKPDEGLSTQSRQKQSESCLDNSTSLENDSMLLPHERVGGDFSWLQEKTEEDISVLRANELEEEESFLYGTEVSPQTEKRKPQELHGSAVQHSPLSSCQNPLQAKQAPQIPYSFSNLDSEQCEKIKSILSSLGIPSHSENNPMKTLELKEGSEPPAVALSSDTAMATLNNPNVRKALESLESLIRATKEKRTKSGSSQTADQHQKSNEDRRKEKRAKISQIETFAAELEQLLKQDGQDYLSPVVGFYCKKCQEFIGDLSSAEGHADMHARSSRKEQLDWEGKGVGRGHNQSSSQAPSHRRGSNDSRNCKGFHQSWKNQTHSHHDRGGQLDHKGFFLKEEMKKERMLITVSGGLTSPLPAVRVKEELREQAVPGTSKEGAGSTKSRKEKEESSDSSRDDSSPKNKPPRKKKKKKEKKKKKDKGDKS